MKVTRKHAFSIGLVGGLGLFVVANLITYPMSRSLRLSPKLGLLDDGYASGFPFAFYFVWDGVPRESAFVLIELVLNLSIAVVCSFAIGLLFKKILGKPVRESSNGQTQRRES